MKRGLSPGFSAGAAHRLARERFLGESREVQLRHTTDGAQIDRSVKRGGAKRSVQTAMHQALPNEDNEASLPGRQRAAPRGMALAPSPPLPPKREKAAPAGAHADKK